MNWEQTAEKFYSKFTDWIISFGPRVLLSFILLIVGLWVTRLLKAKLKNHLLTRRLNPSLQPFIEGIAVISLYIVLFLLIIEVLGIKLTMFAAMVAAFGAAVGLALSGTLQNFASGVLILLLKPFENGDNIIAQGFEGTVASIQIFYTVLIAFDKRTVIIPNSKLSNEVIVNITRIGSRRLDIELKFPFGADLQKIKETIRRIIEESADILKDPVPRIGVSSFVDDGYKLLINVWLNAHGFEDTKLLIHERIVTGLKEAGIWEPPK